MAVAPERMHIAVLGPGAIGGLLAGLMARGGDDVLVLARETASKAIADDGLTIESQRFGNFRARIRAKSRLSGPVDACLVAVKSTQLQEAIGRVPPDALDAAMLIPFLNGIDHVGFLRETFPLASVVAATIRVESARVGAGVIQQMSPFASVEIAATDANRDRVTRLADRWTAAGFDVRVRDDETTMLWEKLSFLAPLALMTTHRRASAGAVRTRWRSETLAVIEEVARVARAEGAAIDADAVVRLLDSVPETMQSSMQRDQAAGLPLEIDAIGGVVVRRARGAGIDVPVTRQLVDEIRGRQRSA